jgi:hypothetical protein
LAPLTQERACFVEITVRVHVDGLDPLATDRDGQFVPRRLLGARAVQETTAAKEDAGCSRSGAGFDKITARRHDDPKRLCDIGVAAVMPVRRTG